VPFGGLLGGRATRGLTNRVSITNSLAPLAFRRSPSPILCPSRITQRASRECSVCGVCGASSDRCVLGIGFASGPATSA
jgi:hypothetical protein